MFIINASAMYIEWKISQERKFDSINEHHSENAFGGLGNTSNLNLKTHKPWNLFWLNNKSIEKRVRWREMSF